MKKLFFVLPIVSILSNLIGSCMPPQVASPTATALPISIDTFQPTPSKTMVPSDTVRVPEDQPTIQAAIDSAPEGGLVLVAPGIYNEHLIIRKTITLASHFHSTGDEQFINDTIIDGGGRGSVIRVNKAVGPDTKIIGFTIQNGEDGIKARGVFQVLNNRFLNHTDAIDYQDGGGLNRGNIYENNSDDGIDLDGATGVTIEGNIIRNNNNDGIEIRLHEYSGPVLTIIIRENFIIGNLEDGIQLIDYPDVSDRVFIIERNLIQGSAMAGLGLMDNGETNEDFRAASIPERIYLTNNTFNDNPYAVSGGDNLIALNNLFLNSATLALKNVDADSVVAHNLFWNNALNNESTNVDQDTNLFSDPMLNENAEPQPGSPAIDAGTAHFEWMGEIVLELESDIYFGSAPDLGMFEVK